MGSGCHFSVTMSLILAASTLKSIHTFVIFNQSCSRRRFIHFGSNPIKVKLIKNVFLRYRVNLK